MPTCGCGADLTGRRRKCDGCKSTGRTGAATKKPRTSRTPKAKVSTPGAETPEVAEVVYPDGLRARGRQLWKSLGHDIDTPGGHLALEACRSADRLQSLDSLLSGAESWFDLVEQIPGTGQYVVIISAPLAEARQQQTTFKQLLAELGATRVKGNPGYGGETGKPAGPTPPVPAATPLAAARERRRQREQKA